MAWSSTDLPAAEQSDLALDKPLILSGNILYDSNVSVKWTTTGTRTDSDASATGYDADRVQDKYSHLVTRPTTGASSGVDRYFHFWASSGTLADFDSIVIIGHNFDEGTGLEVDFDIADDAGFSTNKETLKNWTSISDKKRLVSISLGDSGDSAPNYYSSVTDCRLKFHSISSGSLIPEIGEIYLARRLQLTQWPLLAYDPDSQAPRHEDFVSRTGVITRHVLNNPQRKLRAQINPDNTTDQATVETFHTNCVGWSEPFIWMDEPNTDPQNAPLYFMKSAFDFAYNGPLERRITFDATEQGGSLIYNEYNG